MPQMAPMSWMTLYMIFSLIFILYNLNNYFCFLYKMKYQQMKKSNIHINWKW
nr:ATP synthase F0 subunit 8 [Oxypeltus quadrispinosus]QVM79117.1 ATP synthase F0 subunit 8 [Oxypeltus quadrispinosus]